MRTDSIEQAIRDFLESELKAEVRCGGGFNEGWFIFRTKKRIERKRIGELRIECNYMADSDSKPEELIDRLKSHRPRVIDSLERGGEVRVTAGDVSP